MHTACFRTYCISAGEICTEQFLLVKYAQSTPHALEHTVFLLVKYAQSTPHALEHTVFLQVKYAQCTPHALEHTVFLLVKYAQCTPHALEHTVFLRASARLLRLSVRGTGNKEIFWYQPSVKRYSLSVEKVSFISVFQHV